MLSVFCRFALLLAVIAPTLFSVSSAHAQAGPTASRRYGVDVFGGLSGTWTGLEGGRNLGLTAGVDLNLFPHLPVLPSLEVRGTYPVDGGQIDSQKNFMAGVKLARPYGRFLPYGDVLYGRNEIRYENGGYDVPSQNLIYTQTDGSALALGGGIDLPLTMHFAFKADYQWQHLETPVTRSVHINANSVTLGVVYHLPYGLRRNRMK